MTLFHPPDSPFCSVHPLHRKPCSFCRADDTGIPVLREVIDEAAPISPELWKEIEGLSVKKESTIIDWNPDVTAWDLATWAVGARVSHYDLLVLEFATKDAEDAMYTPLQVARTVQRVIECAHYANLFLDFFYQEKR